MTFQAIAFEADAAEKAGQSNLFFDGNTAQTVKITRAEFVRSKTGAIGIEFDVVNREKQKGYFTLYHIKADGSKNEYAYKTLQSLMGATGVQNLTPTEISVKKYDWKTQKEQDTVCTNAAELIGKIFVGLFVITYSLYQGEEKNKIELFAAYNKNRQSYREQCANAPAQDINDDYDAMLKKSQKSREKLEREKKYSGNYSQAPQSQSFDDDDIQF